MKETYDFNEFMAYFYVCIAVGMAFYGVHLWTSPTVLNLSDFGSIKDYEMAIRDNDLMKVLSPLSAVLFFAIGIVNIYHKETK